MQIQKKNLVNCPFLLQVIVLYLQGYDVTIKYYLGKEMLLANTLSCHVPFSSAETTLHVAIHHVEMSDSCKAASKVLSVMTHFYMYNLRWSPMAAQMTYLLNAQQYPQCWGQHNATWWGTSHSILHKDYQAIIKHQFCTHPCVYHLSINVDMRYTVGSCETRQCSRS